MNLPISWKFHFLEEVIVGEALLELKPEARSLIGVERGCDVSYFFFTG